MNAKRLLMLAEKLETLPRKRFDYSRWVGDDWKGKPDLSCGTTACALGWATTIPALRRAGLRLMNDGDGAFVTIKGKEDDPGGFNPYIAASEIFDIGYLEAQFLFTPDNGYYCHGLGLNATPKQVAKLIRRFVAANGDIEKLRK